jgi:hypothetical protein
MARTLDAPDLTGQYQFGIMSNDVAFFSRGGILSEIAKGNFTDFQVQVHISPTDGRIGSNLGIELRVDRTGSSEASVIYDNVRLSDSGLPEPASSIMLLACTPLALRRRRSLYAAPRLS